MSVKTQCQSQLPASSSAISVKMKVVGGPQIQTHYDPKTKLSTVKKVTFPWHEKIPQSAVTTYYIFAA